MNHLFVRSYVRCTSGRPDVENRRLKHRRLKHRFSLQCFVLSPSLFDSPRSTPGAAIALIWFWSFFLIGAMDWFMAFLSCRAVESPANIDDGSLLDVNSCQHSELIALGITSTDTVVAQRPYSENDWKTLADYCTADDLAILRTYCKIDSPSGPPLSLTPE